MEHVDLSSLSSRNFDVLKNVQKTKVNTDITPVSLNKEIPKNLVDMDYSEESKDDLIKFFDDPFANVKLKNNSNTKNDATFYNPVEGNIQRNKQSTVSNELNMLKEIEIVPIKTKYEDEFTLQVKAYQSECQKEIVTYDSYLKDVNQELENIEKARKEIEKYASFVSDHEIRIENHIKERAGEFQTIGMSEEIQKSLGLTNEKVREMSFDELLIYLEKNDEYVKELREGLKQNKKELDEEVKKLTQF